ncbi:MAG TPA: UDP-N-acetylglucosamine 2-epimerase (non-hydrolyzing) [Thermoleophilaceae bacterium]|nr:UDP-N-acetylglucosamine 2-epimerase (non-hydrolyzing) [Thermoleophilaceae bacterium]
MSGRGRKIVSVVGTRPNFMKMAPIVAELDRRGDGFESVLVHTGQHYDPIMSEVFFEELGIGRPDHMLDVGSGSHAQQTARVMERLEPVLLEEQPDLVLVPGDVNSTLAAALVASKLGIPIGHVEAGLRSFDRTMPEEINRIVTDRVSDLLFTHSPEAQDHLLAEGAAQEAIHYVGNTMIDTLVAMRARVESLQAARGRGLEPGGYVLVTLHRPALVDGPLLADAIEALIELSRELPIVFPAHPRTRKAMETLGLDPRSERFTVLEPLGYLDFLSLLGDAAAVVTDSGGIQEESTYLGVPSFTLRDNTERPVTLTMGTNRLLGLRPQLLTEVPQMIAEVAAREALVPPLWDGAASGRIVDVLAAELPLDAAVSTTRRVA